MMNFSADYLVSSLFPGAFIACPMVFIAGFIDAIAGGGGLITLPAYVFAGLPVHEAVATNKMSSSMGITAATYEFARKGFINWKTAPFCAIFSLFGSAIGSNINLLISDNILKIIMVVLIPLTAFYVLKNNKIESDKEPYSYTKTLIICVFIAFVIGIYGGFYGAGTGVFLLLLFTGLARVSLNEAAGSSKVVNLCANYTALAVYLYNGKVNLPLGILAGFFSMAGNYLGASLFTKKGSKFVRPMIIAVLVLFLIKVLYELF